MRRKTALLLILAMLLAGAGAYFVTSFYKGDSSQQTMAEWNQTLQEGSAPNGFGTIAQGGTETGAASTSVTTGTSTITNASTVADTSSVTGSSMEAATSQQATNSGTAVQDTVQSIVQNPAGKPALRFIAVGDIMLGRGVGMRLQKEGNYEKAFDKVASVLRQGDVVFANLESPITTNTHSLDSKRKIVLKAKPESVSAITSAGINVVSIANNHMMDYYETGLFDTMDILSANHILFAGSGRNIEEARKPAILEKNGIKIGILAYSDMAELVFAGNPYLRYAAEKNKSGVLPRKYETIKEDVLKLRGQVDLLAVSLHWGTEDSFTVTQEQKDFAHKLIDDGVDLILGHHPHQFQGIEVYRGKPIFYSMGNFLFDQNESENMESFILDMKYNGTELVGLEAIPVRILDKSHVEIQTGANAANLLARESELCSKLGTPPRNVADKLVFLDGKEGE